MGKLSPFYFPSYHIPRQFFCRCASGSGGEDWHRKRHQGEGSQGEGGHGMGGQRLTRHSAQDGYGGGFGKEDEAVLGKKKKKWIVRERT